MEDKKRRANALLRRIWSYRKYKEIMEICDVYAGWEDYDRDITGYYLRHLGKEGKAQRAIRTFHREEERSSGSRFFSPLNLPEDAERRIEIRDSILAMLTWTKLVFQVRKG